MDIGSRWTKLFAACGGDALVSRLQRRNHSEKKAHKAELNEWENEGGNPAPPSAASDTVVTKGSA
jgi:hypothetical protein